LISHRRFVPILYAAGLLAAWVLLMLLPAAAQTACARTEARLQTVDGARVLYLRGAPYVRGYEYGRLLADDIRHALTRYLNVGIVKNWNVPRQHLEQAAAQMEPYIPAEVRQEMRGIADGAGVSYEDILMLNTHVDAVAHGASDAPQAGGCSGVAVFGSRTEDGRVLHGHNVDWTTEEEVQRHAVLLVIAPDDGIPFCMPTHAGMVCCNAGMNAAGITYSDMTSVSSDQRLAAMPLMIMARMLLEKAGTLDQALDLLRQWPDTCGWNMIITDAKGPDARAVEISAHHMKVFAPGDPAENTRTGAALTEAIVRTNHFIDADMFALACKRFGVSFDEGVEMIGRDGTFQRYKALQEWVRADRAPVRPQDILDWLGTPPVGNPGNLQSMVFDPMNQRLWIADAAADGAPACDSRYSRVSLKPYFEHQR
jgi:isopenicillin-N N-acyltransferase-like protein